MKRALCIVLCLCLLISFAGCAFTGADKAFYDIPFTSETTALVLREEAEATHQNEYYFFTSMQDLKKGLEMLSQTFDLSVAAEGETQSFFSLAEDYTQDFFKENVLLFVKRYHSTEAVLQMQSLEAVNNAFQIHATLESGAPAVSSYRVYLLAFPKQYLLSSEATVDVSTESVEPQTTSELNALTVAVGTRCKMVSDNAAADALIAQIQAMSLTPSDYNFDNHTYTTGDVTVVGRGFYAVFTDDCICIGVNVYAPDSHAKQTVADAFQTLPGTVTTFETEPASDKDR